MTIDDFGRVDAWEARPDWLPNDATDYGVRAEDGIACFWANGAAKGMKWTRATRGADAGLLPWLLIRYRCVHYDRDTPDYLLWINDGSRPGGWPVLAKDAILADGQWHTQAIDLASAGVSGTLQTIALQVCADARGRGELYVDSITLAEAPPADAEGVPTRTELKRTAVSMADASDWRMEPSWLANPCADARVSTTQGGTEFMVPKVGEGMKWSRSLTDESSATRTGPITGVGWLEVRYRARGIAPVRDYFVYVAGAPGGRSEQEQYVILLSDLSADGEWHTAIARLSAVSEVNALAVQVQAAQPNAAIEIGDLAFADVKPQLTFEQMLPYHKTWATAHPGMVALDIGAACNQSGDETAKALGLSSWVKPGDITVRGVPFRVGDRVASTSLFAPSSVRIALPEPAAEVYLLMAARFPPTEEPGFGGGAMAAIHQVERLVAKLHYEDGEVEEQFPWRLASEKHEVARGIDVYALACTRSGRLKSVEVVDGMPRGSFAVIAASAARTSSGLADRLRPRPAPAWPTFPRPPRVTPTVRLADHEIVVVNSTTKLVLDLSKGVTLKSLTSYLPGAADMRVAPGPLVSIRVGEDEVTSADLTVERVASARVGTGQGYAVLLAGEAGGRPIRVKLGIGVREDGGREGDPGAVALEFEGEGLASESSTSGKEAARPAQVVFPILRGIAFGPNPADTWCFYPRRGAVINNIPLRLRTPYCGEFPFQVMSAFGPRAGAGLYLMTLDSKGDTERYYCLTKSNEGVDLSIEAPAWRKGDALRTSMGLHQGDWHEALRVYQHWLRSWYRPAAPRKEWFRRVFNFRQQFLHFPVPQASGLFDDATKQFAVDKVLRHDEQAFGGVDYLHLFDWGWSKDFGRCGDYDHWEQLGGVDNFAKAIAQVQDKGIPVGLYIEGYLVDPQSNLGKAHGQEWQLLDAQGRPYSYFAPSYNMCPWHPDWRAYLAATYARVRKQTSARGFYIDEYGFAGPGHTCYNEAHPHPPGVWPGPGERETTKTVRRALGPDAALYTEESPTDVASQYQDGSFTYAISTVSDEWSPTHLNLYRFVLPDFKTFEIICCDQPLGSNVEAVKRIVFNGEGIWLEGIPEDWFDEQTLDFIRRMHRVMEENADCFISPSPRPLVPTLVEGVHANLFPSSPYGMGKTAWTVYNTNYVEARGELLSVQHISGAEYYDAWRDVKLTPRIEEGRSLTKQAFLSLDLGPREVTVIVRKAPR
jgi:hypothetical protein